MSPIITFGREVGSGGREIGRRFAAKLQFAYYDQEIVSELVKRTHFTEEYIQRIEENGILPLLPIAVGRTFYPALCRFMFLIIRLKIHYSRTLSNV